MNSSNNYFNTDEVKKAAQGRWKDILNSLVGISYLSLQNRHQPCPLCGGEDRYRFDDKHRSGTYFCNNCGPGDGWKLLMELNHWDFPTALKAVARYLSVQPEAPEIPAAEREELVKETNYIVSAQASDNAGPFHGGKRATLYYCKKSKDINVSYDELWDWYDELGCRQGYIGRYKRSDGGKVVHQILWVELEDGRHVWAIGSIQKDRPLVGVESIGEATSVLVVEGETTRDAAKKLLPNAAVVTWVGGAGAVSKSNWTALQNKNVVIIPDNDEAGLKAALGYYDSYGNLVPGIVQRLTNLATKITVINPPADKPQGWDLKDGLDEGWTGQDALLLIKNNKRTELEPLPGKLVSVDLVPVDTEIIDTEESGISADNKEKKKSKKAEKPAKRRPEDVLDAGTEVIFFGYDRGRHYLMGRGTKQITSFKATELTKLNLTSLAPTLFWEARFPASGKDNVDWGAAAEWVMRSSEDKGIYSAKRLRGRGVWYDDGRIVIHLGDRLLVDGEMISVCDIQSKFIYEQSAAIKPPILEPLTKDEIDNIIKITRLINWEVPAHADCLLGWLCDAKVCGTLDWRAHINLNGASGSGKSTVLTHFMLPLLGDFVLQPVGGTSEAGLRAHIMNDAVPVLFDEADILDKSARLKIEPCLELARQSSTETGGSIMKSSADQTGKEWNSRANYCFNSTTPLAKHEPDQSRITLLNMKPPRMKTQEEIESREARYKELLNRLGEMLGYPNLGERFWGYNILLIPIRIENLKIFKKVIAKRFNSARLGDQLGTMVNSFWTFANGRVGTEEEITDFVLSQEWNAYSEYLEVSQDQQLLNIILQSPIRVPTEPGGSRDIPVGQAISIVTQLFDPHKYNKQDIVDVLQESGIKVDTENKMFYIANQSLGIGKMLSNTAVTSNWHKILARVEGAIKPDKPLYFGPALRSQRAVGFPLAILEKEQQNIPTDEDSYLEILEL